MGKKSCPGGFGRTLATARRLAVQGFGTAKGLEPDRRTDLEGYFRMEPENLVISINPHIGMSGCIVARMGLCTAGHRCIGCFDFAISNCNAGFCYQPRDCIRLCCEEGQACA